jgi:hypothetical protein
MLKRKQETMLGRNHNRYKWSVLVVTSIYVLFAAWPISVYPSKPQAVQNASQVNKSPCLKIKDLLRDRQGHLRWFSSHELMERVIDEQPVERPGTLGKNNLRGIVTIQVVIDKDGKVSCAHGEEGHPLGLASVIRSLYKWTFRPYVSGGKRKPIVGILAIPYNFGSYDGKQ